MEIMITTDVEKSQIIGQEEEMKKVSELPEGIRTIIVLLLASLWEVNQIIIKGEIQDALFALKPDNRYVDLAIFDSKREFEPPINPEFRTAMELLKWYLGPHWIGWGGAGVIGGSVHCVDCGYSKPAGASGEYCPDPNCPSHKKWKQVIGLSYQPPENPLFAVEIKVQDGFPKSN